MLHLEAWQWALGMVAAFSIGVSKTGVSGLGILAVALFAYVLPGKGSPGLLLPILLCADVVAVTAYRRHADWSHLWRLLPWSGVGVVLGWLAVGHIDSSRVSTLIGLIIALLVILQFARQRSMSHPPSSAVAAAPDAPASVKSLTTTQVPDRAAMLTSLLAIGTGVLAGFMTMVANAAGPIMVLYLVASGLPKVKHIGTGAWFYLVMNAVKVPFSTQLGLINHATLPVDALLAPFAVAGALSGRALLHRLDEAHFNNLALALTLLAALNLALGTLLSPALKLLGH